MKNLYHSLLLLIAGSTQKVLAAPIRYFKIENDVLRSKLPSRVSVTAQEKNRLVKFASSQSSQLHVVSGTSPTTDCAYYSTVASSKWHPMVATKFPEEPSMNVRLTEG